MKALLAPIAGALTLPLPANAVAQSGSIMNCGEWGGSGMVGYGGAWLPILLLVAFLFLLALVITQERN